MRLEAPVPAEVLEAIRSPFLERPVFNLEAPVLQPLGLLLDLAGETLRERLFVVQTADAGPEACLRTDFTLPALTAHLGSGRAAGRYFYSGHVFRVAPAGSHRAEEFPQIGIEVYEPGDQAQADAEMAVTAWRAAAAGGRDDLSLIMGDVSLFGAVVDALDLAPPLATRLKRAFTSPRKLRAELESAVHREAAVTGIGDRLGALLAGLSEAEGTRILEDIWALAGVEPVGGRSAVEIVQRLVERAALATAPRLSPLQADLIGRFMTISGEPEAALEAVARLVGKSSSALDRVIEGWSRRVRALHAAGLDDAAFKLSAAFGRTFGYYDGMVFEVRSEALGADQPVAAGGRYDSLPGKLGASLPTGAVGCMVRPGRAWVGAKR
jgi:ATP phosphoribosyltransferase regulatory subunit